MDFYKHFVLLKRRRRRGKKKRNEKCSDSQNRFTLKELKYNGVSLKFFFLRKTISESFVRTLQPF